MASRSRLPPSSTAVQLGVLLQRWRDACGVGGGGAAPPPRWVAAALLAADAIGGAALLALLAHPASAPLAALDELDALLRASVRWLASLPLGMRLNAPLVATLGGAGLAVIDGWAALRRAAPLSDALLLALLRGCARVGGASLALAAAADLLALCTAHVRLLAAQLAWLTRHALAALATLWRLFRGLKWNPLRARVDRAGFDPAQLLLGTLCFCTLALLLPSLLAFAALSVALQGGLAVALCALSAAVAVLNALPVAALARAGSACRRGRLVRACGARIVAVDAAAAAGGGAWRLVAPCADPSLAGALCEAAAALARAAASGAADAAAAAPWG